MTPISLQSGGLSVAFSPTVSTDLGRCDTAPTSRPEQGFSALEAPSRCDNSDTGSCRDFLFGPFDRCANGFSPCARSVAIGSGSWPTRKASPSGPDYARANREGSGGDDLATAVARQSFKTPTSAPWSHGGGGGELQKQVNARLTRDGLYTTPTRDDTGYRKEPYAQGGVALSAQAGGPLNPTWVEWLMGFPLDWTALPPSEIPSSRRSRSGSAGASSKRKKDG
jgi:hypothetical protein